MATAPKDLSELRSAILFATALDANAVGIAPDRRHLAGGGYHCGVQDIKNIGKWDTDYSTRQQRDRVDGNLASAMDVGDDWPRGGRAAWLRFNRLLLKLLQARDPALATIRAINVSRDGVERKRWDSLHPHDGPAGDGVIASTDNVDIHTHIEWWRDTAGQRQPAVQRVMEIVAAALNNKPLEASVMAIPDAEQRKANTGALNADNALFHALSGHNPIVGNHSVDTGAAVEFPNVLAEIKTLVQALPTSGAVVTPTPEQWAALIDAVNNHIDTLLAAKIGTAVELALSGPAGQAAIVAAVNTAEDS